jgi:DNA-binding IclR family transcriptional regulator
VNETGNIKSAERAVLILDHFAAVRTPQRLSDLAAGLALPKSSCAGLLDTLVDIGMLAYNAATKRYFPTDKVRLLGDWLSPASPLHQGVITAARRLYRELGEAVAVGRPVGIHLQWLFFLGKMHSSDSGRTPAGRVMPLCEMVGGLAVLSRRSDADVQAIVEAHNSQFGAGRQVSAPDLLAQVQALRGKDHVSGIAAETPAWGTVSICLGDAQRGDEYLLSVLLPAPSLKAREAQVAALMKQKLKDALPESEPW